MSDISKAVRIIGWRQGDIIDSTPSINALIKSSCDFIDHKEADILLIITQDCDLVRSEDTEPYFDFIIGNYVEVSDGALTYGKNPRRIHIPLNGKIVEFSIHDRFRVRKADIIRISPNKSSLIFSNGDLRLVIQWISKRYIRPAFPDTFNKRLNHVRRKQAEISKSHVLDQVSMIFLDVINAELPQNENYDIQILVGIKDEVSNELKEEIDDLINDAFSAPGITIFDLRIMSEDDITLNLVRTYKRWDWDYRSLPDEPEKVSPFIEVDVT